MSQFRFRLASLLRLREATRDERRAELAHAYQADQALADRQQGLLGAIDDNRRRLRLAARPGTVNVDHLLGGHRHELLLIAQKELVDRQRQQLLAEIDRRRERLAEADREVKALEKLRERQQGRFISARNQREQKLLDEVAAQCDRQAKSA